ncbi:MAG: (d)CMP kinase, partial [Candidatus Puniceispirillaceae bacterium]
VRAGLVALQRGFATAPPHGDGAVLDGRDIGSVILPDADFKFFIDADPETRAHRRTRELQAAGQSAMFRDVLKDMRERDRRDRERQTAPLIAAGDALIIDSSDLDADSVLTKAIDHINTIRGQ